ncbi:MAG: zinc ribbon-containing protein [Pseudomonadota bacterium]
MKDEHTTRERWHAAYDKMMARVRTALEEAEENTRPKVSAFIDKARDTAVELEELTRDEAERVAYYLRRDLEDAGRHLAETGHELGDWLRFDVHQIEDRLLEIFASVADRTRLEMLQFEQEVDEGLAWHAGEVTGPGSLTCDACGAVTRFSATGTIPPCANCGHTVFHRPPPQAPADD